MTIKQQSHQQLIDLQETFNSYGWKLYQQELEKEFRKADVEFHRANTLDEFKTTQGYYNAIQKVFKIPDFMASRIKEILDKEDSVHQP